VVLSPPSGGASSEVVKITRDGLYNLDGDTIQLRVENSERGDRETPVPARLSSDLHTVANARGLSTTDPVVDRDPDTVTRWVRGAAHDLRRTWRATGARDRRLTRDPTNS
jgi:hypothetical protein